MIEFAAIYCEGITQNWPKSTWNTSFACGESISGCSDCPAQEQNRHIRLTVASANMAANQTSVSYRLAEHPAPLRRSCYTFGHCRGRIWHMCRCPRLSPPHWRYNMALTIDSPARREIDSSAPDDWQAHGNVCVRARVGYSAPCATQFHLWSCLVCLEPVCSRQDTSACRPPEWSMSESTSSSVPTLDSVLVTRSAWTRTVCSCSC